MKLVAAMMLACGALLLMRAATASSDDTPTMTSYRNDTLRIVKYKFSYELPDGTRAKEEGVLKNAGTEAEVLSVKGSFRWYDPAHYADGTIDYVADEKGFRITYERIISPENLEAHVIASLLGSGG